MKTAGYRHPIGRDTNAGPGETPAHVLFPYVGDLLLTISDGDTLRNVNWTIKRLHDQHGTPATPDEEENIELYRMKQKAHRRLTIERLYYNSADIPTYTIAFEDFHRLVTGNLLRLYYFSQMAQPIDASTKLLLVTHMLNGMEKQLSFNEISRLFALKYRVSLDVAVNWGYLAIWKRWIRVDLYQTIFPDRKLNPEKQDLVEIIRKNWLGEKSCR